MNWGAMLCWMGLHAWRCVSLPTLAIAPTLVYRCRRCGCEEARYPYD